MEDTNYCVYLHRRTDNDDIIYVGEGRETRAKNVAKSSCRNKAHCKILTETTIYCEFYKQGLTKVEAENLEEQLIAELTQQGAPLTNKNKSATKAQSYLGKDFSDKFEVDPISPSGLRWKMDRYNLKTGGYKLVSKGDIAGCKNKTTNYWTVLNKFCHRIVYAIIHGECPLNLTIDHIDGNKNNNSIENLQLMSRNENSIKSHIGRKYHQGENSSSSKLKDEQVLQMYALFKQFKTNEEVGELFNLHSRYVSLIRHGKRRKELYNEYGEKFPDSAKEETTTKQQIREVLDLLPILTNKEISDITKVEVSTVSRLRSGKTLKKLVEIVNQERKL